jgi:hypothetical protein
MRRFLADLICHLFHRRAWEKSRCGDWLFIRCARCGEAWVEPVE